MRLAAVCLAAALLSACATRTPVDVPPVTAPCPPEALAAVPAEPAHPVADPVELGLVFGAIARAIGEDKAQALVRYWESTLPTHASQGWERVKQTRTWCEAR